MNKYKILIQQTIRQAIKAGVIALVAIGVYVGVSMLEATVEEGKKDAESRLNADKTLLSSLTSQMDKSGQAEKRYLEMMDKRTREDFSGNPETFKSWLGQYRDFYRITMTSTPRSGAEVPSDKSDLVNLQGYSVYIRPALKLEFDAITDLHVFSLIEEMRRSAPGLVRIDKLEIDRKPGVDLTDSMIEGMRTGSGVQSLTKAALEISVIGIRPKEEKTDKAAGEKKN